MSEFLHPMYPQSKVASEWYTYLPPDLPFDVFSTFPLSTMTIDSRHNVDKFIYWEFFSSWANLSGWGAVGNLVASDQLGTVQHQFHCQISRTHQGQVTYLTIWPYQKAAQSPMPWWALGVHCALWWACIWCACEWSELWPASYTFLKLKELLIHVVFASASSISGIRKPTWPQQCHGLCYRLAHCLCSPCISHQCSQPFRSLPLPHPVVWLTLDQWQPLHWGVLQHTVQNQLLAAQGYH